MSHKSVPKEFPTRVSYKSVPQECPTRVAHKSVLQSVPQECPTRVSFGHISFSIVFAFGFVGSILFHLQFVFGRETHPQEWLNKGYAGWHETNTAKRLKHPHTVGFFTTNRVLLELRNGAPCFLRLGVWVCRGAACVHPSWQVFFP